MAFGKPTRYLKLDISSVEGGVEAWDKAVKEASDIYSGRMVCTCRIISFVVNAFH